MLIGQGLFLVVVDDGVGDFFVGGDQCQGFFGGLGIVEDYCGFDGIVDGMGDQLLVGVGIGVQGQQVDQGYCQFGGEYCDQCYVQVCVIEYLVQ